MIYSKNESTKIRTLPLDKNVIISLDDGNGRYTVDQYKFVQKFDLYKSTGGEKDYYVTIKNGVVTKVESIYRP